MRVAVIFGTRRDEYTFHESIQEIVEQYDAVITGCATGVDASARSSARQLKLPVFSLHADWDALGDSAGPERNGNMAVLADILCDAGHDVVCYAFPDRWSKGTWGMKRKLEALGFEVITIPNQAK